MKCLFPVFVCGCGFTLSGVLCVCLIKWFLTRAHEWDGLSSPSTVEGDFNAESVNESQENLQADDYEEQLSQITEVGK